MEGKIFELKCGTIVNITSNKIIIERKSAKSKFKGIYASEGKEQVMIKLSAISNVIFDVGTYDELKPVYDYLLSLT